MYGATPWQSVRLFWTRYVTFTGRAGRAEFWWWFLVSAVVGVLLEVVRLVLLGGSVEAYADDDLFGLPSLPSNLWMLATAVPGLAQTARRLHDTDRSGWWQAVALVPLVGWVLLLVWCARPSDPAGARFDGAGGPRPSDAQLTAHRGAGPAPDEPGGRTRSGPP